MCWFQFGSSSLICIHLQENRLSLCNVMSTREQHSFARHPRVCALNTQHSSRMLDLLPMNDYILSSMPFIRHRRCACRFDCVNAYILLLLYSLSHVYRYEHHRIHTVSRQIDNKSSSRHTKSLHQSQHKHLIIIIIRVQLELFSGMCGAYSVGKFDRKWLVTKLFPIHFSESQLLKIINFQKSSISCNLNHSVH